MIKPFLTHTKYTKQVSNFPNQYSQDFVHRIFKNQGQAYRFLKNQFWLSGSFSGNQSMQEHIMICMKAFPSWAKYHGEKEINWNNK